MRVFTPLQALSASSTIAVLVGCTSASDILPTQTVPTIGAHSVSNRLAAGHLSSGVFKYTNRSRDRAIGRSSCPAKGSIEYLADNLQNVINIYAGKFANQAPCGQLASTMISYPTGMYVKDATHDLYVANTGANNILVFHRGQTTPYNVYVEPSYQLPIDVVVAKDGTVLASNARIDGRQRGSISTWIEGSNGGTYVGTFPMFNAFQGLFITIRKNGAVYYDQLDRSTESGSLWHVLCPAGNCRTRIQEKGVSFHYPGGMEFDEAGNLVVTDVYVGVAETFTLPSPQPSTFPAPGYPFGIAFNKVNDHVFIANMTTNNAAEYSYPDGTLIGTVSGNSFGGVSGLALDP